MTELLPLTDGFASTRRALHLISFYGFSYARQQADGEVWMTPTPGGIGTPPFDGRVLRFDGVEMVEEIDRVETKREPITTLRTALAFAGVEFDRARGERNDIEVPDDLDERFEVAAGAAASFAAFYSLGNEVLGGLVAEAADGDRTAVRLWGEHFDLAIELGSEAEKRRASVGFSPGDDHIPEPYVYVAPWWKDETAHLLPSTAAFGGVALRYSDLLAAENPGGVAAHFIGSALTQLSAKGSAVA